MCDFPKPFDAEQTRKLRSLERRARNVCMACPAPLSSTSLCKGCFFSTFLSVVNGGGNADGETETKTAKRKA